ncbi:phage terminase small subunit [Lysobacter sp. TAF61]|uniref:phage terminase small subunit n=1 Tax=Lysobacter sp. TAF61 TaxID=3233072 RepID=UPI003F987467
MTIARRHFQRVTAAEASASAEVGEPINANAYELMLARLYEDKRRLKELQSIERKIEIKRQIVADYAPWIDGVLEAGRGGQDAVLMTVMVWRIDAGDHLGALQIADYALRFGLVLPEQYQRDTATLVAEEISDQALAALSTGGSFDASVLDVTEQLTSSHDMPDEVRAKLQKALGLSIAALMKEGTPIADGRRWAEQSIEHLRRAMQLHDRAGVKRNIEQLERYLRNNPAPAPDANASSTDQATQRTAAETGAPGDASTDQPGAPAPATLES